MVSEINAASNADIDALKLDTKTLAKYGIEFKRIAIPTNDLGYKMLRYLMRSEKITKDGIQIKLMYKYVLKHSSTNISIEDVKSQFIPLYNAMKSIGVILLRDKSIGTPRIARSISHYMFKFAK